MKIAAAALAIGALLFTGMTFMNTKDLSFMEAYAAEDHALLIDVRTQEEFNEGHIEGAINIDFYDPSFAQKVADIAEGKNLYLYCRSGSRSASAVQMLAEQGLIAKSMEGGILAYTGELVR